MSIGDETLLKFSGVPLGEACSVVLRGATEQIIGKFPFKGGLRRMIICEHVNVNNKFRSWSWCRCRCRNFWQAGAAPNRLWLWDTACKLYIFESVSDPWPLVPYGIYLAVTAFIGLGEQLPGWKTLLKHWTQPLMVDIVDWLIGLKYWLWNCSVGTYVTNLSCWSCDTGTDIINFSVVSKFKATRSTRCLFRYCILLDIVHC
jgi:hypothetical protein